MPAQVTLSGASVNASAINPVYWNAAAAAFYQASLSSPQAPVTASPLSYSAATTPAAFMSALLGVGPAAAAFANAVDQAVASLFGGTGSPITTNGNDPAVTSAVGVTRTGTLSTAADMNALVTRPAVLRGICYEAIKDQAGSFNGLQGFSGAGAPTVPQTPAYNATYLLSVAQSIALSFNMFLTSAADTTPTQPTNYFSPEATV